jgi:diguanylate cyclase (GGDEF)-like protein
VLLLLSGIRRIRRNLKPGQDQASTAGSPLALLLLDLDHFKQVNDQRGHAVGDQVLANVGAVLQSVLRSSRRGLPGVGFPGSDRPDPLASSMR